MEVELVGCRAGRGVLDPVIGDVLRTVGHRDRSALAEFERCERAPHRCVVLVGVAVQVVRVLDREREDRPSDAVPAYRGHAVNDVVVGIGMPCAFYLCVGFLRPRRKAKDGERPSLIGHEEAVAARDVFFCVNSARVAVWPLCRVPIRLHETPGMIICPLNEDEGLIGSKPNLCASRL